MRLLRIHVSLSLSRDIAYSRAAAKCLSTRQIGVECHFRWSAAVLGESQMYSSASAGHRRAVSGFSQLCGFVRPCHVAVRLSES